MPSASAAGRQSTMVDRSDRIELASRAHPRGSGVLDLGKRILFPHSRLNGANRLSARVWAACLAAGSAETRQAFYGAPTGGDISVGPYSSTAVPLRWSAKMHAGPNKVGFSPGLIVFRARRRVAGWPGRWGT